MSIKMRVTDKQLTELVEINCLWNARRLSANEAMSKLWRLFIQENLALWNKPAFVKSINPNEVRRPTE